ncbi:TRAP transporter small permease [Roseibium sp. CAU 1637]|uniref:TRAP transporter small permease protein n=1 Tax=Roseibium limicola TaxID=2816037 RepID=A0A939J5S9_9HYPH|nr:TRAP transporter small permease [Roseibium limicola]MBO0346145.1 TRAP transporter small permease [Roseibium limicola]
MHAFLQRIAGGWAFLGGVLVIAIVLVTAVNVGAFLLDSLLKPMGIFVPGLPGYEDFVRLAISVAALSFFPYCQVRRGHVSVELFVQHFPPTLQNILDRMWLLCTVFVALFLGYWMIQGMLETRADHAMTSILGWDEWPWYIPGIISMALWALVCLIQTFERKTHG